MKEKIVKSYFSHDSNARSDDKILALRMKHKWEGYGLYWALIEKLRDATCYKLPADYNVLAYDLRSDASIIKSIINDFGLFSFTDNGECFYSESLLRRMEVKDDISASRKESALKRWRKEQPQGGNDANALQSQCKSNASAMQNDAKKSKVKESKEDNKESTNVDEKETEPSGSCLFASSENEDYQAFNKWLKEKTPYISNPKNMPHQITEDEYLKLMGLYTKDQISDVLEQLENRKDKRKNYVNLYKTALNWAKRNYGK